MKVSNYCGWSFHFTWQTHPPFGCPKWTNCECQLRQGKSRWYSSQVLVSLSSVLLAVTEWQRALLFKLVDSGGICQCIGNKPWDRRWSKGKYMVVPPKESKIWNSEIWTKNWNMSHFEIAWSLVTIHLWRRLKRFGTVFPQVVHTSKPRHAIKLGWSHSGPQESEEGMVDKEAR